MPPLKFFLAALVLWPALAAPSAVLAQTSGSCESGQTCVFYNDGPYYTVIGNYTDYTVKSGGTVTRHHFARDLDPNSSAAAMEAYEGDIIPDTGAWALADLVYGVNSVNRHLKVTQERH